MDAAAMLAVGGVTVWCLQRRLFSQPLIPVSDPKLSDAIGFTNP
jgi:hypothetical protein